MKQLAYHLELITPAFCGGAAPDLEAEIRAPAIRGQLRWWFRTLGGFARLADKPIEVQETLVFGKAGIASQLVVRVAPLPGCPPLASQARANADDLRAAAGTPLGYALFPLRPVQRPVRQPSQRAEEDDRRRGVLWPKQMRFALQLLWHGPLEMADDIHALASVFGHLGSLGFRSRRGFGALAFARSNPMQPLALTDALAAFAPNGQPPIVVRRLDATTNDWRGATEKLLTWLRSWRQHGQMNQRWDPRTNAWMLITDEQRAAQRNQPGFRYARRDHNEGLDVQGTHASYPDPERPMGRKGETFRPALGLPIQQRFSSLAGSDGRPLPRKAATVEWTWENGDRFASPVLLRPHRDNDGQWHALIIFADSRQWPADTPVCLNGQPRKVLPTLYEAMKNDPRLQAFP